MRLSFLIFLTLVFTLSSCSWSLKRADNTENQALVEATKPQAQDLAPTSPLGAQANHESKVENESQMEKEREIASKPKVANHHEEKVGIDPEKALGWLKNGNIRFKKNRKCQKRRFKICPLVF